MPSPRENSALWDYVVISEVTLPPDGVSGHAHVMAGIEFELDPKKAKGGTGARTTSQGRKGGDSVDIEVTFQDALNSAGESQYDLVVAAIETIKNKPGPYGVAHGSTDFADVLHIMIEKVTSPKWEKGKGIITIKAQRWDAPAKGIGGGLPLDPATAAEIKAIQEHIARLQAEIAANPSSSFNDLKRVEITALQAKINSLRTSATRTPNKSDPTKQWSQGGQSPSPQGTVPGTKSIPLGEIQPPNMP